MSIQAKYSWLQRAYQDMLQGIGVLIQKGKLSRRFDTIVLSDGEHQQLQKAKELCELRIIELWDNQKSDEFKALAGNAASSASVS